MYSTSHPSRSHQPSLGDQVTSPFPGKSFFFFYFCSMMKIRVEFNVGNARLIACFKKGIKTAWFFFSILAICVISIGEIVIHSFVNTAGPGRGARSMPSSNSLRTETCATFCASTALYILNHLTNLPLSLLPFWIYSPLFVFIFSLVPGILTSLFHGHNSRNRWTNWLATHWLTWRPWGSADWLERVAVDLWTPQVLTELKV